MSRTSGSSFLFRGGNFVDCLTATPLAAITVCLIAHPLFAQAQRNPYSTGVQLTVPDIGSASSITREVRDVFGHASHAVVKVHGVDEHSDIYGTGFFVDPTGTLYTSYTVGGDAGNFTVEFAGKKYPAQQIVADVRSGVAMLKIDAVTPALPIGQTRQLEVATPVITIGYPLDLPATPSFGMIAGFDRKYLGRYFSTTHLRVNLPTQRGEAGAPLLNLNGEVVGIIVSSLENNSSCYALPIEAAEKIRSDFVRFGEPRHGWVGANVTQAAEPVEGSRAAITDVLDTPAADAGMKPGDILLQVGKTKVREPEDVLDASFFITAGDTVPITVMRGRQKLTFNVQAEVHPGSKHVPMYPDGTRVPMSAMGPNRGMVPLGLQASPPPKQ
jgi:serine protease Do